MFLLSAGAGVWIAYDKPAAWGKFGLIVGGLILYRLLAHLPEQIYINAWDVPTLEWILGSLPALVAFYFFLTNDWSSRIGKVPALDPAMRWFAAWQPNLAALRVNSNVIGGVIAALLPLQIAALFQTQTRKSIWIGAMLAASSGVALLMSASRGAWLALVIAATGWGMWHLINRLSPRWTESQSNTRAVWAVALTVILLSISLILVFTPLGERILVLRSDRQAVWRNSLDLARDYAFTGLGLGNFEMAYSSYVLLVHVGHTVHAHNLLLDLWLEQGLLGLVALGWIAALVVWTRGAASRWRLAALVSCGVILLHGLVDDAFYGYGGQAVWLMFVPLALLARSVEVPKVRHVLLQLAEVLVGVGAILILAAWVLPGARAAIVSNLGAVNQTRTELATYHWSESLFQDVVRRKVDLSTAIGYYEAALLLDPSDVTANRRLGQIELARGQYDEAQRHLSAAQTAAPGQRATIQLLGECYAIAGETGQAAILWKTIDVSQGQLELRQWWYGEYLEEPELAARVMRAQTSLGQ